MPGSPCPSQKQMLHDDSSIASAYIDTGRFPKSGKFFGEFQKLVSISTFSSL